MSVKNPITSKKYALDKAELKAQEAVKQLRASNQRHVRDQAAVEAAKEVFVAAKAKTDDTAKALLDLYKRFYSEN